MKKQIWLDLDDFGETNNRLDWLWMLKKEFPNFKVNLFTIPNNISDAFRIYIQKLKWIKLCIHGYYHRHNEEVDYNELSAMLPIICSFAKVYRAPFWQLSDTMYKRLTKLKYKIMLHPDDKREGVKFNWNIKDSPPDLPIIYGHGHIQDYPIGPKGNGIIQAFGNIMKLPRNIEFKFL